jgi:carbonic anhydrase/acetyltransferase-like protein (isoleucine patch superfamily)
MVAPMRYALHDREPSLANDAVFIAPNAAVIGDVVLEDGSSVWFGATLRGDTERLTVGARSNVQDGAVLHADPGAPLTIGADVTVGHLAMLHGCTIGDACLIGIGAVILNRAVIGPRCIIGAGALVPEGREIPAGSMVMGMPGKVVRPTTAPEHALIELSARHYVANAARFLAGLRPHGG